MPSTSNAALGLLYVFNGSATARWNFPETVGDHWNSGAGIGDGVAIKYSFLSSVPSYYSGVGGFQKFSTAQQDAAVSVLKSIEEIADIDFSKASGVGQITFANSYQQQGQGGFAYSPNYAYMYSGNRVTSVTENKPAGDVWINRNESWDAKTDWKPGGDGYLTLLHEVGHALGLKHPFEGNYRVTSSLDSERYTVMSYTHASKTTLIEVKGSQSNYSWQESSLRPSTLMPMDIDALQYLYGANTSTRSGSTTYKWDKNEELLETIWDGGGTDTIDCSNQVFSNIINLEATTYSSIGLRQTAAEIRSGLDLPSWFNNLPSSTYDGSYNLAIARGVVIENAKGGSGRDIISGNAAANNLAGNAGNDTLSGGAGNDTLHGGSGTDSMTGGSGNDTFYVDSTGDIVKESKSGGTDLVLSYLTSHTLASYVEGGRIMSGGTANLTGNGGDNVLYAGSGNNVLVGGSGSDTVSYAYASKGVAASLAVTTAQATGGSGSDQFSSIENLAGSAYGDKLTGNGGANRLAGGEGRDTLTGGAGKDIFDFNTLADTGTSSSKWDVITDFVRGQDDIDVSTLDAKSATSTNDAFKFIGSSSFSAAGQLRYVWSASKDYGVLYGNTDSDSAAEFAVQVAGVSSLSASDFIA
ncbi:MAG: M10 family metallopeptidase [Ramlibacter sp.]